MRWRDLSICFFCTLIAIGLLSVAAGKLDPINDNRQEMGLVSNPPLENAPPSLAFATVAMGAFRGLVVDILWMRADHLKQEGHFFDAKQLAEWITVLQPRFANVWDFHAWNMAYNISVAIPANQWEERWRWVRNGLELLRDKGIPKNPHSIFLYRSLAWIFQNKIGGVGDDCHIHYKRELAMDMQFLLDPFTNEYIQLLADAPHELSEIAEDPEIAGFIEALQQSSDMFDDRERFVSNYLSLRRTPDKFDRKVFEVIDRFRTTETLKKFDTFAKAYQLRKVWKMEPAFMQELNKKHGPIRSADPNDRDPLNWAQADSHAIYWAEAGLKRAGKPQQYSIDEKNTDRIVFHSLQSLYRRGKLVFYPIPDQLPSVFLQPDLRMFEVCNQGWIQRIEKYEDFDKSAGTTGGHRNFLRNAVASFYQAGQIAKAGKIYNELRERYPRDDVKVPLVVFVRNRLWEEFQTLGGQDAIEFILLTLREGYFRYAIREDDEAYGREKLSEEVYQMYQKEFGDDEMHRLDLPDFQLMRYWALLGFINDPFYPEYLRKNLLARIKIERPSLYEKLSQQEGTMMQELDDSQDQP